MSFAPSLPILVTGLSAGTELPAGGGHPRSSAPVAQRRSSRQRAAPVAKGLRAPGTFRSPQSPTGGIWARLGVLAALVVAASAYRELLEGSNPGAALFEPYHPGFVESYGDPTNPRRFRVNPGGPLMATQPNVFAGVAPRQVCPNMTGPMSDGAYYCTAEYAGLCDRRSGTCFCFEGYEGPSCNDCRLTHHRVPGSNECYPRVLCPLDCSGAGACNHTTGVCTCNSHREGSGCETPRCPGLDPNCNSCDKHACRGCREGYALTHTNLCAPCWLIDPRCLECTAQGKCTQCADPLLNSIRRSGRRLRDFPLPFDEVVRELSHGLPFATSSPLFFEEAEPFFDIAEAERAHEQSRRVAMAFVRAAHAMNLTKHPAAALALHTHAVATPARVPESSSQVLSWGDGQLLGEPFPSMTQLGIGPGLLPGVVSSLFAPDSGAHSATASRLLAAGFVPSWPNWKQAFWPLYDADKNNSGADAYTRLARRGNAATAAASSAAVGEQSLLNFANVTGMGQDLEPAMQSEVDGRSEWFAGSDPTAPAVLETAARSNLVPFPNNTEYYLALNSTNSVRWDPFSWYGARGMSPLKREAVHCDRGLWFDRRWRCNAAPVSHSVCGHPGTLSWASPAWVVREDEGRLRVAVRRTGGGLGRVEAQWWIVHNTTGAADVSASANYEGGGSLPGGGANHLVFEEGVVQLSFELTIHDDRIFEGNETAWIVLGLGPHSGGAVLGPQRVARLIIIDDDQERVSPLHSMVSSTAAVATSPSHPATRLAGSSAAMELAAVAGEPLPILIHARAPPFGANFLGGTDQTLSGVQGAALAELDAAYRAGLQGGSPITNENATLPSSEPRLLVPFAAHWLEGGYSGEEPGSIRYDVQVWPARGAGSLGLGARGGRARVPSATSGYAAFGAGVDLASPESAARADALASPESMTAHWGRLGRDDALDVAGWGSLFDSRAQSGQARSIQDGQWTWEEGEASSTGGGSGGSGWGVSGVSRRLSPNGGAPDNGASSHWIAYQRASAPGDAYSNPLPWEPSTTTTDVSSGQWEGDDAALAAQPWRFRFGAGYGQGRLLGAPVAQGSVVWAGALSPAMADSLNQVQRTAGASNAPMGARVQDAANASFTDLSALLARGTAGTAVDARRLDSVYVGLVRPFRAGDYEVHVTQCSPGGLLGEYWPNREMLGPASVARIDAGVNFTWGHSSSGGGGDSGTGIAAASMSVRWTGKLTLPASVSQAALSAFSNAADNAASWGDGTREIREFAPGHTSANSLAGWFPWWARSGSSPGMAGTTSPGVLVRIYLSAGRGDQARLFVDHRLVLDRWGPEYKGPFGAGGAGSRGGQGDAEGAADLLRSSETDIAVTRFRTPEAAVALDPVAGAPAGTPAGTVSPGNLARVPSPAVAAFPDPFSLTHGWQSSPRSRSNMSDAYVDVVLTPGRLHDIRLEWRGSGHPHSAIRLEWALPADLVSSPPRTASAQTQSLSAELTPPSPLFNIREPFLTAAYTPASSVMATNMTLPVSMADQVGAPTPLDPALNGSDASGLNAFLGAGVPLRRLVRSAIPARVLLSERRLLGTPIPLRVRAAAASAVPSRVVDAGATEGSVKRQIANGELLSEVDSLLVALEAEATGARSTFPPWLLKADASVGGRAFGSSRGGGAEVFGLGVRTAMAGSPSSFIVASRDAWGNDRLEFGSSDGYRSVLVTHNSLPPGSITDGSSLAAVAWPVPGLRSNGSEADSSLRPPESGPASLPGAVIPVTVAFDRFTRSHHAVYEPTQSGVHWLHVQLWTAWGQWTAVRGSPFAVAVGPGPITAATCNMSGLLVTSPLTLEPNPVLVTVHDAFVNPVPATSPASLGGRLARVHATIAPIGSRLHVDQHLPGSPLASEAADVLARGVEIPLAAPELLIPVPPSARAAANYPAASAYLTPITPANVVRDSLRAVTGQVLSPDSPAATGFATYRADVHPRVSGASVVSVTIGGTHVEGSPVSLDVLPSATAPSSCVIAGRALTVMNATLPNSFAVLLRDGHGNPRRVFAGETVTSAISVDGSSSHPDLARQPLAALSLIDWLANPATASVIESTAATTPSSDVVILTSTPLSAGLWPLSVMVNGEHVFGSPTLVRVVPGPLHPPSSVARGSGLARTIAGVRSYVDVEVRDSANNTRAGPASAFDDWNSLAVAWTLVQPSAGDASRLASAEALAQDSVVITRLAVPKSGGSLTTPRRGEAEANALAMLGQVPSALSSGYYRVSSAPTVAGNWTLSVTAAGTHIAGSPFSVQVMPNALHPLSSVASGPGLDSSAEAAGLVLEVIILGRDAWGNDVMQGGDASRIAAWRSVLIPPPSALGRNVDSFAGLPQQRLVVPADPFTTVIDGDGPLRVKDLGNGNYSIHYVAVDAAMPAVVSLGVLPSAPLDENFALSQHGGLATFPGDAAGLVRRVYRRAGDSDTLAETALETAAALATVPLGGWPASPSPQATGTIGGGEAADLVRRAVEASTSFGSALSLWLQPREAVSVRLADQVGIGFALPLPEGGNFSELPRVTPFATPTTSIGLAPSPWEGMSGLNVSSSDALAEWSQQWLLRPAPATALFGPFGPLGLSREAVTPNGSMGLSLGPGQTAEWGVRWDGYWRLDAPEPSSPVSEWTVVVVGTMDLSVRLRLGSPHVASAPLEWQEPVAVDKSSPMASASAVAGDAQGVASAAATVGASRLDPPLAGLGQASRAASGSRFSPPFIPAAAWVDGTRDAQSQGGLIRVANATDAAMSSGVSWTWKPVSGSERDALLKEAILAARARDSDQGDLSTPGAGELSGERKVAVYAVKLVRTAHASTLRDSHAWVPVVLEVAAPAGRADIVDGVALLAKSPTTREPRILAPIHARTPTVDDVATQYSSPPRPLSLFQLAPPLTRSIATTPRAVVTTPAQVSHRHSVAAGDALHYAIANLATSFLVELRDEFHNPCRLDGSSQVTAVAIRSRSYNGDQTAPDLLQATCFRVHNATNASPSEYALVNCTYTAEEAGTYALYVAVNPSLPPASEGVEALRRSLEASRINGAPFELYVAPLLGDPASTVAYGPSLQETIAGELTAFVVQPRDWQKNNLTLHPSAPHGIEATLSLNPAGQTFLEDGLVPPAGLTVSAHCQWELSSWANAELAEQRIAAGQPVVSIVACEYHPTVAGDYLLAIRDHGVAIAGSPFSVRVKPSRAVASRSYTVGLGRPPPPDTNAFFPGRTPSASAVTIGEAAALAQNLSNSWASVSEFSIVVRDRFGNRRGGGANVNRNEGADATGQGFLLPGADDVLAVRVWGEGEYDRQFVSAIVEPRSLDPALRGQYRVRVPAMASGTFPAGSTLRVDSLLLSGEVAVSVANSTSSGSSQGHGLVGRYFAGDWLQGGAVATRLDETLGLAHWPVDASSSFWDSGAAGVVGLRGSRGSVRWDGWIVAPVTGMYEFAVSSSGAARITIGSAPTTIVVDHWPELTGSAAAQSLHTACQSHPQQWCVGSAAYSLAGQQDQPATAASVRLEAGQAYEIEISWRPPAQPGGTASPELLWAFAGTGVDQSRGFHAVPSGALWPAAQPIFDSPTVVHV
jgi:hypothetical protein